MMGIRWVPPKDDWVKINSDGAVKGVEQRAFVGGVIRDRQGNWIKGHCRNIVICSALQSEIWAVYDGLRLGKGFQEDTRRKW